MQTEIMHGMARTGRCTVYELCRPHDHRNQSRDSDAHGPNCDLLFELILE